MTLDKIKTIAIVLVCVLAILVLGESAYTIHVLRPKAIETVSNLNDTTGDVKEYVHEQLAIVRSPAFQKNIEHSSEVGDITAKTIAQIARRTLPRVDRAIDELTARLVTLDTVLVSVRGVSDEARVQVKHNGDEATKTLASLNRTISDVDTRFSKILDDGALMLETANPKLQELLDHTSAVMIDADGTIKSFQPVGVNLAGITADFNAMTTDSRNKLHEILFPAPKHGWARVGQVATYLLRPVFEGARLYFQLTALPVRITQPVPLPKAP